MRYAENKKNEFNAFKKFFPANLPVELKTYLVEFIQHFYKDLELFEEYRETMHKDGYVHTISGCEGETSVILVKKDESMLDGGIDYFKFRIKFVEMVTKIYFLQILLKNKSIEIKTEDLIKSIFMGHKDYKLKRFEKGLQKRIISMDDIDSMDGFEFEDFLRKLFEKMGYSVKQTKLSGDQGADLIVEKMGEITLVQAKRAGSKISNKAVQEVVASIKFYKGHQGIVVTNNFFTPSAIELAKHNAVKLINREELNHFIIENF